MNAPRGLPSGLGVLMSVEMHVLFRGQLPSKAALQRAMRDLGFPFTIRPARGSLETQRGFMPMMLRRQETGVEFDVFEGRDAVEELLRGGRTVDPAFDRCANFRWGGDETEAVAGMCAAAALAGLVGGLVIDEYQDAPLTLDAAAGLARRHLASLPPSRAPRPRLGLKRLLRPLLDLRPDLALFGNRLVVRPVRHLLRGALFGRGDNDGEFRVWRTIEPLYGEDEPNDFRTAIAGPWNFSHGFVQPLLLEVLAEEIFPTLAETTTLADFVQDIEGAHNWEMAAFRALLLGGERERATALVEEFERREGTGYVQFATFCRLLLGWDAAELGRRYRGREAVVAKVLKLGDAWEPTPFPAEVAPAERPACSDPVVPSGPWVPTPPGTWSALPETPGEVSFFDQVWWDFARIRAWLPLAREEAEKRHRARARFDVVWREPGGALVGVGWSWARPWWHLERQVPSTVVSVASAAGRLRAVFTEPRTIPQALGMTRLEVRPSGDVQWHAHCYADPDDSMKLTYAPRHQVGRDDRKVTSAEIAERVVPVPPFGDHETLLVSLTRVLEVEGYAEFLRQGRREGWAR